MRSHGLFAVVLLFSLAGCAKETALPDTTVSATTPDEFKQFRTELGRHFAAAQLTDFDTATLELQLDAMARDIPTAAGRELDMLAVANRKTVRVVTLLGWQARRARFLREIAELTQMLTHDRQLQAKTAASAAPESVLTRLRSEQEVIAQLQDKLADTARRLAEMKRNSDK